MANVTRQQLAQFLPTPELIKAFEALFATATDTTPTNIDELLQQLGTARNAPNLTPLINRLIELELMVQQKPNLTGLIQRIEKIENFLGI